MNATAPRRRPSRRKPEPRKLAVIPKTAAARPILTYVSQCFIWHAPQVHRWMALSVGFRWDEKRGYAWTRDFEIAAKLAEYADAAAVPVLAPALDDIAKQALTLEASHATDADIVIPAPPGHAYLPYQKAGIAYANTDSRPGTLIGDEPGLGKTMQALGLMNLHPEWKHVLIVCPASLKIMWRRAAEEWLVHQPWVMIAGQHFPTGANVVIVNYDVLHKFVGDDDHPGPIRRIVWDLVVADEAHFAKNPTARRSMALHRINAHHRLYLTGTPICNRPAELWTLVSVLAPSVFNNYKEYSDRFCQVRGDNRAGKSILSDLQELVRSTCMIRRLKKQVLKDLPDKQRQVVELEPTTSEAAAYVAEEQAIVAAEMEAMVKSRVRVELAKAAGERAYAAALADMKSTQEDRFSKLSALRHKTALAKVPFVIEHLKNLVENDIKVVCFAHHHDVIDKIVAAFGAQAVELTGTSSMQERQHAIDGFQRDPKIKLFVGNILAAGTGITLTASDHVVFAELDWVPGNMTQAEDRCHRIGQKNNVTVEHLVLAQSLDSTMARILVNKQVTIDAALDLDRDALANVPLVPMPEEHATAGLTRLQVERSAATIGPSVKAELEGQLVRLLDAPGVAAANVIDRMMIAALAGRSLLQAEAVLAMRLVRRYVDQETGRIG